jgi:hypothetical protein
VADRILRERGDGPYGRQDIRFAFSSPRQCAFSGLSTVRLHNCSL